MTNVACQGRRSCKNRIDMESLLPAIDSTSPPIMYARPVPIAGPRL